ncbi:hypothetical protein XENOCAPTIV_016731, partial [Xenoophorus captivus]
AKFEMVTSEASYIRSLTIAVDHFMLSQELAECLGAQEKQWLFSKMPEVKDVSERFLQDLEHRLEEDILRFDVCDIVLDHCPALRRVYLPYIFPLISQSRWLVKHGELLEVDTQMMSISGSKLKLPTKPVYLHLFNDCLLTWKFMVFVHARIGELKVKDLSQKLQGISGFIFYLQLCEGQQLKHQILLKSHTE